MTKGTMKTPEALSLRGVVPACCCPVLKRRLFPEGQDDGTHEYCNARQHSRKEFASSDRRFVNGTAAISFLISDQPIFSD